MAGLVEHVVSVIATRDKDDEPAYRATCSCQRLRAPARTMGSEVELAFARAEHDGREHRRYHCDVERLTAARPHGRE